MTICSPPRSMPGLPRSWPPDWTSGFCGSSPNPSALVALGPLLQRPQVAIRILEPGVLDALDVLDLAHIGSSGGEGAASLVDVPHDEVQPLDRSRFHVGDGTHARSEDDRARGAGRCELHD